MRCFCLPEEYQNYIYRPIKIPRLQAVMHGMTIIDSAPTDHGIALRIKRIQTPEKPADPEYPISEKIVIISGEGENISAEVADMERDRLPGHPMQEFHKRIEL